jgi:hypothetical protein
VIRRTTVLAAALACVAAHAAPLLGKEELKAQLVRAKEQYDNSQARCKRVEGPARALCNDRARGERDIQVAQLQFQAEPTADNDQKVRLAKADAAYSRSLLQCKEMDGDARAICRQDAKTVFEDAKTDAGLQREVVAQQLRSEGTVRERGAEEERVAQAQFNAARQRCEALPPEGRLPCMEDAKKRLALP